MASPTPLISAQKATQERSLGQQLNDTNHTSAVLHRSLKSKTPPQVIGGRDKYLEFSDGHVLFDSTGGAGVSCIGQNDKRVRDAMVQQIDKFSYCNSMFYSHQPGEQLAEELIQGTGGAMAKAYIVSSGSEAMEGAMKLARQYFVELEPSQLQRVNFIAREGSYHGTTLGALSMSGHVGRRKIFEGMLMSNVSRVSACYEYRDLRDGQTSDAYVQQLAEELDAKFQEIGPDTICAFVAEPVVGAALGCVPAVFGYFKAMKEVCDKYGALLIFDEVMSGMGRTGTLHAWQQEDVVPDIQTIGKCLGGGYAPIAGFLINHRVVNVLEKGTGIFMHGHTYQGHPVGCAAALEVQRIIREDNLCDNVRTLGLHLGKLLHKYLDHHPYVGDVRGKGLFWAIEFVADKSTKEPFPPSFNVASGMQQKAFRDLGISLYPGVGTKDGIRGDHVLLAPAYTSTVEEIEEVASRTRDTIFQFFEQVDVTTLS